MVIMDDKKCSQDQILSNLKNVMRGLEALKGEHDGLLQGLLHGPVANIADSKDTEDKVLVIKRSLEQIELGLGEGQVSVL